LQEGQYESSVSTIAGRVVQASLKLVLEPIFEADFKPCSYGFRPNRRAHDAISEIYHLASRPKNYHWVFETDIKACFDEISQTALMNRLRARIKDKRICSLVKAFLKSGVLTELGEREETWTGTPQGGFSHHCSPISPCQRWTTISTGNGVRKWAQAGSGKSAKDTARATGSSSAMRMTWS
jgi:retron-type reverse transcriptase